MAKTEETLIIEDVLYQNLFGSNPCLAREYGTKEVTVTLLKEKKVKEIVDFLSYNAKKDEFRCYEIKVSMADFKSKAAKTWIGNYNYLVIPRELYLKQSLYEWKEQIPYAIGLKNKNLIESKVVHPESEYDYVDRFDDDETDYLDYDCRYSLFEPNTKESKNISAKQECMKEGIVKKIPFLLTKEMIAVCINHSNTTYAKFIYEKTDDGKTKVILYPGNVSFVVEIESLSMSSDIRKAKIIFSSLKAQYKDMNEELFNEIQERIIERYIRLMAWEEIEKISTLNFHVRMRECDLLKLYQYYIFDRSRQRLIVNAKPYDNDQLYVNILGNRINLNDILIGDHYKWNPEKFPKIYDGSFKDFLESFDFEANGICRVHDSIYASDENDILIGRKMKSVIDKLF